MNKWMPLILIVVACVAAYLGNDVMDIRDANQKKLMELTLLNTNIEKVEERLARLQKDDNSRLLPIVKAYGKAHDNLERLFKRYGLKEMDFSLKHNNADIKSFHKYIYPVSDHYPWTGQVYLKFVASAEKGSQFTLAPIVEMELGKRDWDVWMEINELRFETDNLKVIGEVRVYGELSDLDRRVLGLPELYSMGGK